MLIRRAQRECMIAFCPRSTCVSRRKNATAAPAHNPRLAPSSPSPRIPPSNAECSAACCQQIGAFLSPESSKDVLSYHYPCYSDGHCGSCYTDMKESNTNEPRRSVMPCPPSCSSLLGLRAIQNRHRKGRQDDPLALGKEKQGI